MRSLALLLLVSLHAGSAWAQAEEIDERSRALDLLRSATKPLEEAASFRAKARVTFDVVQEDGRKLEYGSFNESTIRRPNRVRAEYEYDNGSLRQVFYDGESISVHYPNQKVYGQFATPDNLDDTLDFLEVDIGMPVPLGDLLYSDLSHLGRGADSADYVGRSRALTWICDQLSFTSERVDYQVWIERSETPLIRKYVMTYKKRPGFPQYRAVFLDWDLDAATTDEQFVFRPDPGTERVPILVRPVELQENE